MRILDGGVDGLLPAGTPIDLDNCAREPIHIPGSIQPRGVLAVVREPDFEIRQVSANVADLLGVSVDEVLGRHLSALIGPEQAERVQQSASAFGDLRQRNPLELDLTVDGASTGPSMRCCIAEPGGVLLVELEIAYGAAAVFLPQYLSGGAQLRSRSLNRASVDDRVVLTPPPARCAISPDSTG